VVLNLSIKAMIMRVHLC